MIIKKLINLSITPFVNEVFLAFIVVIVLVYFIIRVFVTHLLVILQVLAEQL